MQGRGGGRGEGGTYSVPLGVGGAGRDGDKGKARGSRGFVD